MILVEQMMSHAREESPRECCGLVVASGNKGRLIRAKNLAGNPLVNFDLDPAAWLELVDGEKVVGVYHSHPRTSAEASQADLMGVEATKLPWHIVNPHTEDYRVFEPTGYVAPYEGRVYVHGSVDCYTVVRDWFAREWGLQLPNFLRADNWWDKGQNLYLDNFEACGFVRLIDQAPEVGDVFLIQRSSSVPNHAVVYVGDGQILHHPAGRLSKVDPWGGVWERHATHHIRHRSRTSG